MPLASQQRRWKPSSSANDGPPTARYDLQLLPSQVDRTSLEHPCESFWLLARLEVSRRTIGRRAEKRVSCTLSVEARAAANPMGERDAVARRGGAVRRGGPNGGPALLAGQANRGRDCGCSDRTADSRSGPSRMTQGVVDLARNRKFESTPPERVCELLVPKRRSPSGAYQNRSSRLPSSRDPAGIDRLSPVRGSIAGSI